MGMTLSLQHGDFRDNDKILRRLVGIQYHRNDIGFAGDVCGRRDKNHSMQRERSGSSWR